MKRLFDRLARQEEGSAVTEFALSTLLLVPVALYSMYVGEAYMVAIKVQEAEISATWDITAYRLHEYMSGSYTGLYSRATSDSATNVSKDIRDFNSFTPGGGNGWSLPISSSTMDAIGCQKVSGNAFTGHSGSSYLHADGYVNCKTKATFKNHFIPQRAHTE
ncbi:MAG: hypothetical protein HY901_25570, partial [Deltaproteobacteria bacterium]|nr:hypothetical protein [Deltaproteobacteria bacterium]